MPFTLNVADRIDSLLEQLAAALPAAVAAVTTATAGVPRPVTVLVASPGAADWIRTRLTRRLGVSMGVEFLSPADWLRRPAGPGGRALAEAAEAWAPENLRWTLLPHVPACAGALGFAPGRDVPGREQLAAADLLARQLDRYARARPAWIQTWARGEAALPGADQAVEDWQRALWSAAAADLGDRAAPAALRARTGVGPGPVFLVGLGGIDPYLLAVLRRTADAGTPVHGLFLLPSLGYLADLRRREAWVAAAGEADAGGDGQHPLLASLGRLAAGTFLQLGEISGDYGEWAEPGPAAAAATLLGHLQADIRAQQPPVAEGRRPFDPGVDQSLRVHACHSRRRELEVLRDELLRAFRDLPGLQPDEVVVAATDLDAYAPLVEGVLGSGGGDRLPYRLSVVPAREANPVASALAALLRLALGRQGASEVLDLLNLPAVQAHLDLDAEARGLLAETVRASGLTHGLGGPGGPVDDGTWAAAVDRVAAGFWFGPAEEARDPAGRPLLPLGDELGGAEADRRRFTAWLDQLASHLRAWAQAAPAPRWAERLDAAITGLLASTAHEEAAVAARNLLAELRPVTAPTLLDAGAMLDWLEQGLENATSFRTGLGGEILIGRPEQVQGLPCRVLAILGLEDGAFPRAERRPAWDLLALRPERWDPDRRAQDRQWFLDAVLTPTDRLILSAANRNLHQPDDGPFSACVADLLRVVDATVPRSPGETGKSAGEAVVVHHPRHPFAPGYFTTESGLPPTFHAGAAAIARDLDRPAEPPPPFLRPAAAEAAPLPASLPVEDVIRFWCDPAAGTLRALEVHLPGETEDATDLDDGPLDLDALQRYQVRTALLAPTGPAEDLQQAQLRVLRRLPVGELGRLTWEAQRAEIGMLQQGIAHAAAGPDRALSLSLGATTLTGTVRLTEPADEVPWVMLWRPTEFQGRPKAELDGYLRTAFAAAALGRPVGARAFDPEHPEGKLLPPIPPEAARQLLDDLLAGLRQGQLSPVAFAPATSEAIRARLEKGGTLAEALEAGFAKWNQEAFDQTPAGEGLSAAAQLVWRDTAPFAAPHDAVWRHWADRLSAPVQSWWRT